jgi:hypothetical protein
MLFLRGILFFFWQGDICHYSFLFGSSNYNITFVLQEQLLRSHLRTDAAERLHFFLYQYNKSQPANQVGLVIEVWKEE